MKVRSTKKVLRSKNAKQYVFTLVRLAFMPVYREPIFAFTASASRLSWFLHKISRKRRGHTLSAPKMLQEIAVCVGETALTSVCVSARSLAKMTEKAPI